MLKKFDPFTDRTARNIRNSLSSALVSQLGGERAPSIDHVAQRWLSEVSAGIHRSYIHKRLRAYHSVIATVHRQQIREDRLQAVALWNMELFFEMHELLETVWHGSKGGERTALKGLIQAAGVYVHSRCNNLKAARGLARRAREHIRAEPTWLRFIRNLDQLIEHLAHPHLAPPMLEPDPSWKPLEKS